MKKIIFVIAIVGLCLTSCTDSEAFASGKEQLESMGYTEVVNTGYESWCCGNDDDFSTGFSAVDSKGNAVSGCFCSGWGKGTTIRFN